MARKFRGTRRERAVAARFNGTAPLMARKYSTTDNASGTNRSASMGPRL